MGASSCGRHGPGGRGPPGSCPGTAGEGEAWRRQVRRRQGNLPGPGLQGTGTGGGDVRRAGGSARGKGAGGEAGAGRRGVLAPTSKGQGRKRWLPDIKGRAGDREGGGALGVSPAGTVGKAGGAEGRPRVRVRALRTRGGREAAALKAVGQLGPSWGGLRPRPRRAAEPHACPPPAGGPLPWAGWRPGRGPGAGGGGVGSPSPRRGRRPGLSYSAFSWKRPWRQNGWWRRPGPAAPPAAAPLRSAPRPGPAPPRAGAAGR